MPHPYSFISNKKGVVLVATYMVLVALLGITGAFYSQVISQKKIAERDETGMEALYAAEAGIAFAYAESKNMGWEWFTHDDEQTKCTTSPPIQMSTPQGSPTIDADGYYVYTLSSTTSFKVKAYPGESVDPIKLVGTTIIRSMGISGTTQRVIEQRLVRKAIYDYYIYTPYNMSLSGTWYVNGGRIHTNENFYMYNSARVVDVSELSTGSEGSFYYVSSQYYRPRDYDRRFDGTVDGKAPLPDLGLPHRWAGTTDEDPYLTQYPWQYEWEDSAGNIHYSWKSYGYEAAGYWAPRPWRSVECFFYGDNEDCFRVEVDGTLLNQYNTWVRPYKMDENGELIEAENKWKEIPAELDQEWDWDKYYGNPRDDEVPVRYVTSDGNDASATHWQIVTDPATGKKQVVMTDNPADPTYWQMLQSYDYWRAIGYGDFDAQRWSTSLLNPEVLDGSIGSERAEGKETIPVKNTNTINQPDAWKNYLKESGLEGVVMDGTTGGQDIAPPRFATSYAQLAQRNGLYIDNEAGRYRDNPADFWAKTEAAIDAAVARLNDNEQSKTVARKVKFINTYTNEPEILLDIDLGEMGEAGNVPENGIIYSQVPIRFSNAKTLPGDKGIHVISEENIYLKGNYNNPGEDKKWMPSAIISKKRIFTLSDNFNDPQTVPALDDYVNYPYLYVARDASGRYEEANPAVNPNGFWVYRDYLDSDGVPDTWEYYPDIDDQNEQKLREEIERKNKVYQNLFDKEDPSGEKTATFNWPAGGDNYTWGMMPPKVKNDTTYNCLMASYWGTDGEVLERWRYYDENNKYRRKDKIMNGAYFKLDWEGFTAHWGEGIDYYDIYTDYSRGIRKIGSFDFEVNSPSIYREYDKRFLSAARSQKAIFFGGAEDSWYEVSSVGF